MPLRTLRRRVRAAALLVVALAVTLLPTGATALPVYGTRDNPFVAALDGSYLADTGDFLSAPGEQQVYYNVFWYALTVPEDTTVGILTSSDGTFDATLEVWVDDELVAENDDWIGLDPGVGIDLVAGTTYLIGVGGLGATEHGEVATRFVTELPETPTDVTADAFSRSALVQWARHASDEDRGVGYYEVWCTDPAGEEWVCGDASVRQNEGSAWVTGLGLNGRAYSARVVARNLLGASVPSEPVTFVPGEPTSTSVTLDPARPVAWEPFDVVVRVVADEPDVMLMDALPEVEDVPPAGTVDLTIGGTTHRDLPLVDGVVVVEATAPAGELRVVAAYDGGADEWSSSGEVVVDVARRADAVELELGDLVLGEQVTPVASSTWGLPVRLTASGACRADDGVVTATAVGDCTVVASTQGDADTFPAANERTATVTAPAPVLVLGGTDALAPGAEVSVTGQGLRPGSTATLMVHSTPRTVATGVVAADGSVELAGVLPADLEPGEHRIVADGTAVDGSPVTAEAAFTVAAAPTPAPSASPSPTAGPGATPAPAAAPTPATGGESLAATGAAAGTATALAAVWLVLGAGLVLVARRRTA